jgi:AmmeMemoRadiSam system protein A
MAEAAAKRDPRFSPIEKSEVPFIDIEISVLSPLQQIDSPDEIKIGKHGLYIEKGSHTGLLLPQVAVDHNLDVEKFLEHTCIKAGLYKEAWKEPDTKIYIFSAQIFSQAELE